jgi:DNA topoisomerase-3
LVQDVQEESKSVQRAAPRLYDLTSLQRDANKRLGLSAKQTLEIAQSLYERHKVLTYPRTDSNALPEDYVDQAKATMRAIAQGGHQVHQAHAKRVLDEGWIHPAKRIFDNSKISDHFAIVPTGTPAQGLSDIEAQIFDMVARRFIAAFNPAAEYLSTTRLTAVAGHRFKSTGRVLTQPGWMSVYGQDLAEEDGDEKEPALCAYRPGESVRNEAVEAKALKTKPPKPFTEASLLSAMETAGKLVEDDELAAAMKERGLGTPATRAAIIEGLLSDGGGKKEPYLRREKKNLVPTPKAISLIGFLREQGIEQLTSPAMTGDWEHQLRQVEAGRMQRASFMAEIERLTREVVATVMEHAAAEAPPQTLSCPCPRCGGQVVATSRTVDCAQACGFRLWRAIAKRSMSIEELQVLVTTRSLPPLEGFISSKTGKPFSAGLALDAEHRATFVFQERSGALPGTPGAGAVPGGPKLDWACPACGKKSLMRNGRVIECSCGQFKLWTMVAKKQLTDTQLATLINRGAVAAKGLTSSKGSKFDATLKLDRTGKVSFDFS